MKKLFKIVGIIIIVIFIFSAGVGVGGTEKTQVVTEKVNVPVTKTITQTKTIPADTTEWKALKDIDDQGFTTESQVLAQMPDVANTCADAITAVSNNDQQEENLDEAKMAITTSKIKGLTVDMNNEVNQRALILKQLGY